MTFFQDGLLSESTDWLTQGLTALVWIRSTWGHMIKSLQRCLFKKFGAAKLITSLACRPNHYFQWFPNPYACDAKVFWNWTSRNIGYITTDVAPMKFVTHALPLLLLLLLLLLLIARCSHAFWTEHCAFSRSVPVPSIQGEIRLAILPPVTRAALGPRSLLSLLLGLFPTDVQVWVCYC